MNPLLEFKRIEGIFFTANFAKLSEDAERCHALIGKLIRNLNTSKSKERPLQNVWQPLGPILTRFTEADFPFKNELRFIEKLLKGISVSHSDNKKLF